MLYSKSNLQFSEEVFSTAFENIQDDVMINNITNNIKYVDDSYHYGFLEWVRDCCESNDGIWKREQVHVNLTTQLPPTDRILH